MITPEQTIAFPLGQGILVLLLLGLGVALGRTMWEARRDREVRELVALMVEALVVCQRAIEAAASGDREMQSFLSARAQGVLTRLRWFAVKNPSQRGRRRDS